MIKTDKITKMVPASVDQAVGLEIFLNDTKVSGQVHHSFEPGTLPPMLTIHPKHRGEGIHALNRARTSYNNGVQDVFKLELYIDASNLWIKGKLTVSQAREIAKGLTDMCDYIEEDYKNHVDRKIKTPFNLSGSNSFSHNIDE